MDTRWVSVAAVLVSGSAIATAPPAAGIAAGQEVGTRRQPAEVVATDVGRRLDAIVQKETLGQLWGAVLVADRGNVVLARGYGLANEALEPNTADALFDIGSISKAFTAAAVLRLEMEGKVRLDASIGSYLTDVPQHAVKITLAHLLGHTSGVSGGEGIREDSADEVISEVLASPLKFEPGSRMEYSNAGYFLLAAILEKVAGEPYERYVLEKVLVPAGMVSSTVLGVAAPAGSLVTTRADDGSRRRGLATTQPYHLAWGYKGAGGVVASANDLLRFDAALRGDELLDTAAKERMFKAGPGGYGLGWFVSRSSRGWRHEHSGGVWGYASELVRHEDGTVVIVLTSGRTNPVSLARKLEAELIPEMSEESRVRVHTAGAGLDQQGVLRTQAVLSVVTAEGGKRIVEIRSLGEGSKLLTTLEMRSTTAARIATELGEMRGGGAERGCTIWLATRPYSAAADGIVTLPSDAAIMLQRGFESSGGADGTFRDARVTLIVQDEANSFLPVIVMLDESTREQLARQLAPAK